jgi:peptidoglycan/xylan/chitin deacetylase (PgdA/CDA1 family)
MNKYLIKRELFRWTGQLAYRWNTLKPGLYIFNYHCIGDAAATPFDPNVFSCDEEQFRRHVETIKARFKVINVSQLLALVENSATLTEPLAMITLDDGYRDNFLKAYPILKSLGVPGVFFIPTSFIDNNKVPWWDEIAWMVKHSANATVTIPEMKLHLKIHPGRAAVAENIRQALSRFKAHKEFTPEAKIDLLRNATGRTLDAPDSQDLFMRWEDVRTMLADGMDIGSHTHNHRILSHLEPEYQRFELAESKAMIKEKTGVDVEILAYPVGGLQSYTEETMRITRECGYKLACNFVNGYNRDVVSKPFELHRIPVEDNYKPVDIRFASITTPSKP